MKFIIQQLPSVPALGGDGKTPAIGGENGSVFVLLAYPDGQQKPIHVEWPDDPYPSQADALQKATDWINDLRKAEIVARPYEKATET